MLSSLHMKLVVGVSCTLRDYVFYSANVTKEGSGQRSARYVSQYDGERWVWKRGTSIEVLYRRRERPTRCKICISAWPREIYVKEGNIYGSVVLCLNAFFLQLFPDVFRAPLKYICTLQIFVLMLDVVRFASVTVIFYL